MSACHTREMVPKLLRLVGLLGFPGGRHLRRIIGTLVDHRLQALPFGGSHGKETRMVIARLTSNARMAGCPVRVLMRRQTNGGEDKEEDLRTLKEDKEEDSVVLKKGIREEVGPRKRVRRVRLMVKGRRPGGTTHRGKVSLEHIRHTMGLRRTRTMGDMGCPTCTPLPTLTCICGHLEERRMGGRINTHRIIRDTT